MMVGSDGSDAVDRPSERVYTKWELLRTLWPKTCSISGKRIPMYSNAYHRSSGDIEQWAIPEEYTMAKLKDNI